MKYPAKKKNEMMGINDTGPCKLFIGEISIKINLGYDWQNVNKYFEGVISQFFLI